MGQETRAAAALQNTQKVWEAEAASVTSSKPHPVLSQRPPGPRPPPTRLRE